MARSRRKTPIAGITTASSDGRWKAMAARKLRRRSKQMLGSDPHEFDLAGRRWDVVDPWSCEKDGKSWFGNDHSDCMRK